MKHAAAAQGLVPDMEKIKYGSHMEKKKRLTSEQLDSLERSFQEEIKLDPDRKMKLSRELGLQPRQIAVWFQNRRARWKAKQLENLYDALKQEYDAISEEKQKLQEEVRLYIITLCILYRFHMSLSSLSPHHATHAHHSVKFSQDNDLSLVCLNYEVFVFSLSFVSTKRILVSFVLAFLDRSPYLLRFE